MYRTKDFYLKKVYRNDGKKLGLVEDVCLDFSLSKVTGFKICGSKLISKRNFVDIKDIIIKNGKIIAEKSANKKVPCFKNIKYMEVLDSAGALKGNIDEILIDAEYNIKGIIVSSGIIDNIFKGKEIFLMDKCKYIKDHIIYKGTKKICFKTIPHSLKVQYDF